MSPQLTSYLILGIPGKNSPSHSPEWLHSPPRSAAGQVGGSAIYKKPKTHSNKTNNTETHKSIITFNSIQIGEEKKSMTKKEKKSLTAPSKITFKQRTRTNTFRDFIFFPTSATFHPETLSETTNKQSSTIDYKIIGAKQHRSIQFQSDRKGIRRGNFKPNRK